MIDLNRKPEKSKEEKEFDELNKQYEEKFGKSYVFFIGMHMPSWDETLKDIKKCLETGKAQKTPNYDKDFIY